MPASNLTPEQIERRRKRAEARKARKRVKRRETLRLYAQQARANRHWLIAIGVLGAAAFLWIGFSAIRATDAPEAAIPSPTVMAYAAETGSTQPVTDSAAELWSDDQSRIDTPLLDAPLDAETQWAIYKAAGYDDALFSTVMAIAHHETGFKTDAVGDSGQSLGMMQIYVRWHTARMETLGVTDLTDPIQCAAVAIDYLKELADVYGFEGEALLMAYNMGPAGASNAIAAGTASTEYSREVMTVYQEYLKELEDAK